MSKEAEKKVIFQQDAKNSIAGWFFTAAEIKNALSNGHMLNPSIDLSNPCNLNCPYCYVEEKNSIHKFRKSNELSLDETIRIIDDLALSGAKTINIVGAGEPTIDQHFEVIIRHISSKKIGTVLFTNGISFFHQPDLMKFLYDNNVSIVLKYNSKFEEIQDLVAGRQGYTHKRNMVLDNLIDIGFAAHEPTRLGIDIIIFSGNVDEIAAIHKRCRADNIFPITGEYIPTGRTENGRFQGFKALEGFSQEQKEKITKLLQPIRPSQRKKILQQLRNIDKIFGIKRPEIFAYFGGGICTQTIGLYIDIEGNIWPCVAKKQKAEQRFLTRILGNVRKGDLPSQVWMNSTYMRFIKSNFNGGCPYKPQLGSGN